MKRRLLIILAFLVLFGQWANIEHAYHDHIDGGVCEYCLSAQPLDHSLVDCTHAFIVAKTSYLHDAGFNDSTPIITVRYYSSRAPPHSIQII